MAPAATFGLNGADLDFGMDVPLEPGTGGPHGRPVSPLGTGFPAQASFASAPEATPAGDPRASFIAAARRAAQAAAAEAAGSSLSDMRSRVPVDAPAKGASARASAPKVSTTVAASRSDGVPLSRIRDVLERRKRPILLGLAAAVVALGTLQASKQLLAGADVEAGALPDATSAPISALDGAPPAAVLAPEPETKPQSSLLTPDTFAAVAPESTPAPAPATSPAKSATRSIAASAAEAPSGVPSLAESMLGAGSVSGPTDQTGSVEGPPQRLLEAAKSGDPRGLYDLASRLADPKNARRDLDTAAELYEHAATKGFAPAQYRLASMYEKGLGVAKNIKLAKTWYERAAESGNVKAMHNMAVLYAEGGVDGKPNYVTAAKWFRQASEYGLRDSEYNYAILVARGLGSAPDLNEAYRWFAIAASQGDADAARKRDDVGARLDAKALEALKAEVAAFVPRTAPAMANDTSLPAASWAAADASGT